MNEPSRLFSYGTLQLEQVQRALFGRTLDGTPDALTGYALIELPQRDPAAVAASGVEVHSALVPADGAGPIHGMLYTLSDAELATADRYETGDYARVAVTFVSGRRGFVYVRA